MKTMMHCIMLFAGVCGIVWYTFTGHDFWPVLVYCITLCIIGVASLLKLRESSEIVQKSTLVLNRAAAVLLMALLVSGFAVSPGTGISATAFILIPLVIALTS